MPPEHRIANFILYLNDDFEGGKLEMSFKNDMDLNDLPSDIQTDLLITPKKNTLVIMPSDVWHRVNPVIKGKRKTINGHIGFK